MAYSDDASPAGTDPETAQILARLRACNGADFSDARPMPGQIYHSAAFARHELERIFHREWICLAHISELAEDGAFVTETIGSVPVLVVRQADGSIKAFLNACAHRFAHLVQAQSGTKRLFVCPYHAWSYDAAGRLVRAPHMEDVAHFNRDEISLRELHTEIWEGFIYVSLAPQPPTPLAERLSQMLREVVGRYDMARYRTVIRAEMAVAANWKNMVENFIESYHVFAVHAATFGTSGKGPDDYICGPDMDWCACHWGTQESDQGRGTAHPHNTALEGGWRRRTVVASVFPNHLITLAPDYLWSVTVLPEGFDRMRAVWSVAVAPEVFDDVAEADRARWLEDFRKFMDSANSEDKPVIEALHRGTRMAPGPGRYHPIERNLWNFATYLERMTGPGI